jgi:hypothetical protein
MRIEIEIHPQLHKLTACTAPTNAKPAHIRAGTVRAEDDTSYSLRMPKLQGAICDRIVWPKPKARARFLWLDHSETEPRKHAMGLHAPKAKAARMCTATAPPETEAGAVGCSGTAVPYLAP